MDSEVEESLNRIQSQSEVKGIIVVNDNGLYFSTLLKVTIIHTYYLLVITNYQVTS